MPVYELRANACPVILILLFIYFLVSITLSRVITPSNRVFMSENKIEKKQIITKIIIIFILYGICKGTTAHKNGHTEEKKNSNHIEKNNINKKERFFFLKKRKKDSNKQEITRVKLTTYEYTSHTYTQTSLSG